MKGGAYLVAGVQQAGMTPFRVQVRVDGSELSERGAVMALVGNVPRLQGGFAMFPAASVHDGQLDVLIASPDGLRDWPRLLAALRQGVPTRGLERLQGRRVEIVVDRPVPYELDGDTQGETTRFVAEVAAGALLVMCPPGTRAS